MTDTVDPSDQVDFDVVDEAGRRESVAFDSDVETVYDGGEASDGDRVPENEASAGETSRRPRGEWLVRGRGFNYFIRHNGKRTTTESFRLWPALPTSVHDHLTSYRRRSALTDQCPYWHGGGACTLKADLKAALSHSRNIRRQIADAPADWPTAKTDWEEATASWLMKKSSGGFFRNAIHKHELPEVLDSRFKDTVWAVEVPSGYNTKDSDPFQEGFEQESWVRRAGRARR